MITNIHKREVDAMRHVNALQDEDCRFATMCPNADVSGEWLVMYDPEPSRIDVDALKAAQSII